MNGGEEESNRLEIGDRPITESVFNDPIHGHMELHPLCVSIIDTTEFQRLRHIKQVGMSAYVYPGGNHTRFEHCIGVGHLAAVFARNLSNRQPELDINGRDVLCAQIAGLCHDLGHGPFSHIWQSFLAKKRPKGFEKWQHEQMSVHLFEHIIKTHNLEKSFEEYFGNEYETYIEIVKQQIDGSSESRKERPWKTNADENDKSYLYEIVSNDVNNVDVDKWDYLSRDSHHMGFKQYFDHARLMTFARVCQCDDGKQHICFSMKLTLNIQQMFHARWELHRIAYQHKVAKVLDNMLLDVFCAANEHIKFIGSHGAEKCLSESAYDLISFTKLTDYVLQMIQYSNSPELLEAQNILSRIQNRMLYGFVGQIALSNEIHERIKNDLLKIATDIYELIDRDQLKDSENALDAELIDSDIYVEISRFDYGDKNKNPRNPLEKVFFYTKQKPTYGVRVEPDEVSKMFPKQYEESILFCVCRKKEFTSVVYDAFDKWCKRLNSCVLTIT